MGPVWCQKTLLRRAPTSPAADCPQDFLLGASPFSYEDPPRPRRRRDGGAIAFLVEDQTTCLGLEDMPTTPPPIQKTRFFTLKCRTSTVDTSISMAYCIDNNISITPICDSIPDAHPHMEGSDPHMEGFGVSNLYGFEGPGEVLADEHVPNV